MRVLSRPARRNRARNPYNFLLSEALSNQGCVVADVDRRGVYLEGWDVFHIHWPQNVAAGKLVRATRKSLGLLIQLSTQRLRGTRIVWTVHNVRGNRQSNRWLERVLMWFVMNLVHGVIFLTCSSRAAAIAEFPALESKPYAIIPHGLYQEVSEKTREEARALYELPAESPVVGFFGDIWPYKGLERLLVALQGTPPAAINLFIVGVLEGDDNYRSRIRTHIAVSGPTAILLYSLRIDLVTKTLSMLSARATSPHCLIATHGILVLQSSPWRTTAGFSRATRRSFGSSKRSSESTTSLWRRVI